VKKPHRHTHIHWTDGCTRKTKRRRRTNHSM